MAQAPTDPLQIMAGFPPAKESQVSVRNAGSYPFSKWTFRNIGATLPTLMIPRGGRVHPFTLSDNRLGQAPLATPQGATQTLEQIFATNETDGVIVLRHNTILFEHYWNGLTKDYAHLWFSLTKSLTSSAFGLLVSQGKVDLAASPVRYVPELKGTPWERTTIQDVLNMSTALGFAEDYADTAYFAKTYGVACGLVYAPGADTMTRNGHLMGTYDFLTHQATANRALPPGYKFEYNTSNVDVISWIINRVSGQPYQQFIAENIWAKLGAEHDASITTDRALMAFAGGGMNSTLRDAALFAKLILRRGQLDGKQILPARWVDQTLLLTESDRQRMQRSDDARAMAYKNFWWVLDGAKGEYCAVGLYGQVLYINRAADLVVAYFSSQPLDGPNFLPKLNACRALGSKFIK